MKRDKIKRALTLIMGIILIALSISNFYEGDYALAVLDLVFGMGDLLVWGVWE